MARKLTPQLLNRLIKEELGKMLDVEKAAKDTEEVDADEFADSLEKKIDYLSALKIEEGRLVARLKKLQETKQRVMKSIKKLYG
jgi:hypothetical protein